MRFATVSIARPICTKEPEVLLSTLLYFRPDLSSYSILIMPISLLFFMPIVVGRLALRKMSGMSKLWAFSHLKTLFAYIPNKPLGLNTSHLRIGLTFLWKTTDFQFKIQPLLRSCNIFRVPTAVHFTFIRFMVFQCVTYEKHSNSSQVFLMQKSLGKKSFFEGRVSDTALVCVKKVPWTWLSKDTATTRFCAFIIQERICLQDLSTKLYLLVMTKISSSSRLKNFWERA